MVELIDMFTPTPFNIVLIASIYIMHRSFHAVDPIGFAASGIIALSSNFFMVKYLHANEVVAMLITIFLFPFMEILWAMGMKKLKREQPEPHWPHPHMPRFRHQEAQPQNMARR